MPWGWVTKHIRDRFCQKKDDMEKHTKEHPAASNSFDENNANQSAKEKTQAAEFAILQKLQDTITSNETAELRTRQKTMMF